MVVSKEMYEKMFYTMMDKDRDGKVTKLEVAKMVQAWDLIL